MFIYILQCENDKYYIGKTKNYITRLDQHMNNRGSEWSKRHKPIKVLKVLPCHDGFDEDKYTKMYMSRYGIDNVRGGSYTRDIISDECKQFIEKEFITACDLCYICKQHGHFANKCTMFNKTKAILKNYSYKKDIVIGILIIICILRIIF
jgi:hypothetical protein